MKLIHKFGFCKMKKVCPKVIQCGVTKKWYVSHLHVCDWCGMRDTKTDFSKAVVGPEKNDSGPCTEAPAK